MDYMLAFVISFAFNLFAFGEFFVFWLMAKKQFGGLRNFLMRRFGYGFLVIRKANNDIKPVFKKHEPTMNVNGKQYFLKSERIYNFDGLPALFYNEGDSMPLDLSSMKSDELWRNAKFMDNLFLNIKAGAEAEASANANMQFWLAVGALIFSAAAAGIAGYILYVLTGDGTGVVLNAQ